MSILGNILQSNVSLTKKIKNGKIPDTENWSKLGNRTFCYTYILINISMFIFFCSEDGFKSSQIQMEVTVKFLLGQSQ